MATMSRRRLTLGTEIKLQNIEIYRTMHAACIVSPRTGRLQATHFACCVSSGKRPQWAVWSVASGKLIGTFDSRLAMESAHRGKVWRIKVATWNAGEVSDNIDADTKRAHVRRQADGRGHGGVVSIARRVA